MNSTIEKMKEDGEDRFQQAVATGFHGDSSEHEVEQLLKETITEIGMSTQNPKIECLAKRITHAFICVKDTDERN